MTAEVFGLFAILAGMVLLFLTERIPVDVTAFLGLLLLTFSAYLNPIEAFSGFSSPAVITMAATVFVAAGTLFMATVGRKMLRVRKHAGQRGRNRDLAKLYQLKERLFSLRIPHGSSLHGQDLVTTKFAEALGAEVVEIRRGARHIL